MDLQSSTIAFVARAITTIINTTKPTIGFTSICLCIVGSAFAQIHAAETNTIRGLRLEQAFELAEHFHPGINEAKALVAAGQGRAVQAGAFPNPEAVARIESAPLRGKTAVEAEYVAGLAQQVPLGGRLGKARQVELFELERRTHELQALVRDLRREVHSAFAIALYQQQAFDTQRGVVANMEKMLTTTTARVDAGDALRTELARVEMEISRSNIELRRSASMREQAFLELAHRIGNPTLQIQTLEGSLESAFEIPTLETLAQALVAHPSNAAADADIRLQGARIDLAKAERIPDVKFETLYRRLEVEGRDAFDIGVSIPIPLFDRNKGRLREARGDLAAAEARSAITRNALVSSLRESHAQLTNALEAAQTMRTEILPRAELLRKAAEARYSAGDISLNEALPVRREWAAVQIAYLESLRDVMQAWANISSFIAQDQLRLP